MIFPFIFGAVYLMTFYAGIPSFNVVIASVIFYAAVRAR